MIDLADPVAAAKVYLFDIITMIRRLRTLVIGKLEILMRPDIIKVE